MCYKIKDLPGSKFIITSHHSLNLTKVTKTTTFMTSLLVGVTEISVRTNGGILYKKVTITPSLIRLSSQKLWTTV